MGKKKEEGSRVVEAATTAAAIAVALTSVKLTTFSATTLYILLLTTIGPIGPITKLIILVFYTTIFYFL